VATKNATKSVTYFFTQTPQQYLRLPTALRKQTETTSILPQRWTTGGKLNQPEQYYAQPMSAALRSVAVAAVPAAAVRRVALRCFAD